MKPYLKLPVKFQVLNTKHIILNCFSTIKYFEPYVIYNDRQQKDLAFEQL